MVAKTLFGFEELLVKELRQLGAQDIKQGVRNVSFVGDKGFMYKANLGLRTAIKILKPIKSFKVVNEQDLYDRVYGMKWDKYMKETQTLAIDATVHSEVFTHSKYIALKTKDAIVDKFRDVTGERPNVDLRFPDLKINVHIERSMCTISLDSSGESLHRPHRVLAHLGGQPPRQLSAHGRGRCIPFGRHAGYPEQGSGSRRGEHGARPQYVPGRSALGGMVLGLHVQR